MCLVGEVFEDSSDEVCGAVVQIRTKGDKIAIWTGNAKKDTDVLTIGYDGSLILVLGYTGIPRHPKIRASAAFSYALNLGLLSMDSFYLGSKHIFGVSLHNVVQHLVLYINISM